MDQSEIEHALGRHRGELIGYCYRMLGSAHDAEDAVQETLIRAWRGAAGFEGRSELRSWIYRIATNVCLDHLHGRKRRAVPVELGPPGDATAPLPNARPDDTWVQPIPDRLLASPNGDPADLTVQRDSVRLAFVAALQHLAPRQRAVLILRDVLRWRSAEVAGILDTTVTAVDSTLRRARSALATSELSASTSTVDSDTQQDLLTRYVDAFERFDIDALVALVREDATLSMPPYALWLRGRHALRQWFLEGPGSTCNDHRLIAVGANGTTAFAAYRRTDADGPYEPFGIQVLELATNGIAAIDTFLDPGLFPLFQAPIRPPAREPLEVGGRTCPRWWEISPCGSQERRRRSEP